MKFYTGILLAFLVILIGSPLLALVTGMAFALIFKLPDNFISKSIGTKFLQVGVVILGLTISASSALNITAIYFPYITCPQDIDHHSAHTRTCRRLQTIRSRSSAASTPRSRDRSRTYR